MATDLTRKRFMEIQKRLDKVVGQEVLRSRSDGAIRFGDVWLIATTKGGGPTSVPEEVSCFLEKSTGDMMLLVDEVKRLQSERGILRQALSVAEAALSPRRISDMHQSTLTYRTLRKAAERLVQDPDLILLTRGLERLMERALIKIFMDRIDPDLPDVKILREGFQHLLDHGELPPGEWDYSGEEGKAGGT